MIYTVENVADSLSEGLPDWQREINLAWLWNVHDILQEGGLWGCPALNMVFIKRGPNFETIDELESD